jgi:hypothetical protein
LVSGVFGCVLVLAAMSPLMLGRMLVLRRVMLVMLTLLGRMMRRAPGARRVVA